MPGLLHKYKWVMALAAIGAAGTASAQWVDFTTETSNRLRIRPYVDGTAHVGDDQEKDFAVGDLNKDGWDDTIVVRKRPFSNAGPRQDILLMNRNGRLIDFTARFAPGFLTKLTDARDVQIVDVDNDTWLDVVIGNTFEQQPVLYMNLGRDGQGRWLGLADESERLPQISVPADVNTIQICAVAVGDVTGDGFVDIYMSNYKDTTGTKDLLMINDGTGNFTLEQDRLGAFATVSFGTSSEIHDMDGDGDNDIVKINALFDNPVFDHGVYILFNDGLGNFDNHPYQQVVGVDPYMFTVYDHNGDGMNDVYVVKDSRDRLAIATTQVANGPVQFDITAPPSGRTNGFGGNIKTADIDNDGDLDVGMAPIDVDIANCGFSSEFVLFENLGAGNGLRDNEWPNNEAFNTDPHDFAFIDIDNDGCQDMIMGLCTGWRVFMNTCQ